MPRIPPAIKSSENIEQYLYYSLDEVERQYWHEELGNALEELYGEQRHQVAAQIAGHFSSARRLEKMATYLPMIEYLMPAQ